MGTGKWVRTLIDNMAGDRHCLLFAGEKAIDIGVCLQLPLRCTASESSSRILGQLLTGSGLNVRQIQQPGLDRQAIGSDAGSWKRQQRHAPR